MNWKGTVILAVLAAATFILLMILKPEDEDLGVTRPRPFEWREGVYQTITLRPADQPEVVLRRNAERVQDSLWRLEKLDKPADDARIAEMIHALRRLSRDHVIKPGDPEHTPTTYGLDKPFLSVEVVAATEKVTVKFGNASLRRPDFRFFMLEGEPEIFLGPVDVVPPFQRPVADLRSRTFISYDPARVLHVEVDQKFMTPVIGPDGKPVKGPDEKPIHKAAFEKLKFDFRDQPGGGRKGWYLVSVNGEERDEHAEDGKLGHLISGFKDMKAEEYVDATDASALGFGDPETIVRFDILQPPSTSTLRLVVEVGKTEEKAGRKVTYIRVDGAKEAAVVAAQTVERLPRERKQLISPDLIDFEPNMLEVVELVTATGHRVKLKKEEKDEVRGTERFKAVTWTVVEPANLPVDQNSVNDFVTWIVRVTTSDILGEQPDLASFGLDKPALTMTLRIKSKAGELVDRVYRMGCPGDSKVAYLLKPGGKEVYQLSEDIWRRFDRTDLNFRQLALFNTTIDAIVGMSFTYRQDQFSANPVKYAVRRGEGGKWEFEDPALRKEGIKVDPDRMTELLGQLNFIRAEGFLTRNPRVAHEYRLDDSKPKDPREPEGPMGRLVIRYADPANPGKSAEIVIRISKSYLDLTGKVRLYYAKIEPAKGDTSPSSDSTIVFRIKTEFVEMLRLGVVYETKAAPDSQSEKEGSSTPPPSLPKPAGK